MFKKTVLLSITAALVSACAITQRPTASLLTTAPSPITFDGNVAGRATDVVFSLVPDANPATPGFAMRAGDSLRVALPQSFRRNPQVAINAETGTNLVLTKGWAQGAVRLAGQYRVGYSDASNSIIVTAVKDIGSDGANAPGIKVVHLRGRTFVNPMAGDYPVTVSHVLENGDVVATWTGQLKVLEEAPIARLAPTNFHLPPGTNADYQKVKAGQVAPYPLGVLLWGDHGAALNDVGVAPRDLVRFPKYTGGLLVQDSNHDNRLDPATDKVVGGIIGAAPQGATGQVATSPLGPDGRPMLSGEVPRNGDDPSAAGDGKPKPGLLLIQFRAGDKPGLYQPAVELIGGNRFQFSVEVPAQ